jgi:hypothetical protein
LNKTLIYSLIALSILISGCQAGVPPLTDTAAPTLSLTETAKLVSDLVPTGQPLNEWNGIPIMTGALAGDEKDEMYRFTILASREEIQSFYERQLSQRGWELTATKPGNAGAILMIFSTDQDTVSIYILPNRDTLLVMIIK